MLWGSPSHRKRIPIGIPAEVSANHGHLLPHSWMRKHSFKKTQTFLIEQEPSSESSQPSQLWDNNNKLLYSTKFGVVYYVAIGNQDVFLSAYFVLGMGFKAPKRRLNSKPLVKIRITRHLSFPHSSHCNAPSPTLSNLAYCFLLPTSKGWCPAPQPAPIEALYAPSNQKVYHKTPLSPINQNVSRFIMRPLFSLDYSMRHDSMFIVGFLWLTGSHPTVLVLWQLPSSPAPQCISSGDSPVAVVYQLFYLARNQAGIQRLGELRFITPEGSMEITLWSLNPEEGFHKAFMGYLFRVHAWQTRVTSGKVVDVETSLQKQMCGGGVVGAVG